MGGMTLECTAVMDGLRGTVQLGNVVSDKVIGYLLLQYSRKWLESPALPQQRGAERGV